MSQIIYAGLKGLHSVRTTKGAAPDSSKATLAVADRVERVLEINLRDEEKMSLTQREEMLKQKNQEIQTILHDLRGPLQVIGVIHNGLAKIDAVNATTEGAAYLSLLKNIRDRMAGVIENKQFKERTLNLVIRQIVDEKHCEYADAKDFKLKINFEEQDVIKSNFPRNYLARILANFINNSIEARKNDQVEITIQIPNENTIIFRDSGCGIPPHILKQLQADSGPVSYGKEESSSSGFGLGVYGAQRLLQQFSGKLDITSAFGEGATFTITLPQ